MAFFYGGQARGVQPPGHLSECRLLCKNRRRVLNPKSMPLSLPEFVERWKASTLSERAAAQSHFIDLCEVLEQPHPAAADQTGESFTFEKRRFHRTMTARALPMCGSAAVSAGNTKASTRDLSAAYRAALALSGGPGESAAAGDVRSRAFRGSYQLHRHAPAGLQLHAGRSALRRAHRELCSAARGRSTGRVLRPEPAAPGGRASPRHREEWRRSSPSSPTAWSERD